MRTKGGFRFSYVSYNADFRKVHHIVVYVDRHRELISRLTLPQQAQGVIRRGCSHGKEETTDRVQSTSQVELASTNLFQIRFICRVKVV